MAEMSWDVLYRPGGVSPSQAEPAEPGRFAFLRSWEAWLTLLLLLLVQLPVVGSLESTKWVNEMPSLTLAAFIGVGIGWVLASTRGRALPLHVVGVSLGAIVILGEVLQTMQIADPLDAGFAARWSEFWLRLHDWGQAALTGGVSSDPLPFVLLLVLLMWAISYVSAWAVVRWHNAWAALVPGGFVLLTNISYLPGQPSFAFVVFLFAAVLLLARMHFLQAIRRWQGEHVALPDFMSMEVLFAGAWVGLVLVLSAWLIPTANHWGPIADRWVAVMQPVTQRLDRVGRLFVGINSKKPLPAHAFSDVFPLRGKMALSSNVLMDVTAPAPVNLRGAVYDEYTGGGWKISSESKQPMTGTSVQAASFGTPLTRAQLREPVSVTVKIVGNEIPMTRLLSPGEPLATSVDAQAITGAGGDDVVGLAPTNRVEPGDEYTTVGTISVASAQTLEQSGRDYPAAIATRYTQLPSALPPEVRQLARQIVGNTQNPYESARRVEQYLRDHYPFDLNMQDPPPLHDAVDYFLFDSKQGYFDYHASAMAVLLRTLGIPTRVATGFALDPADLNSATKTYQVSELRAWAWPQVYFAGLGWVDFNPTPTRPAATLPASDAGAQSAQNGGSPLAFPDAFEQSLLDQFAAIDNGGTIGHQAPAASTRGGALGSIVVAMLEVMFGVAAVVVVLGLTGRTAWEWQFRGLAPPVRRWAKVQRLGAWAGATPRSTATPIEAARSLRTRVDEPAALDRLARSYTASRYGGDRASAENDEQARELDGDAARVQRRLWRLVARRLVPLRRRRGEDDGAGSARGDGPVLRR